MLLLGAFWQDIRFGARALLRNRGFAVVAALTLGIGIGANTAIFSVVNGVLLRPLPYPRPEELVDVWGRFLPKSGYDFPYFALSDPEYLDYRRQARALAGVAAYRWSAANLSDTGGEPERVQTAAVSSNLFSVLGLEPALGRTFVAEEDAPGARCAAVLSLGLWRDRFGSSRGVLGRSIFLDGRGCQVVGIMPEDFRFPDPRIRLWTPLALDAANAGDRESHGLSAVGRLAPGVSFAQGEAEMNLLMAGWAKEFPEIHGKGHSLFLSSLLEDVVGDVRQALLVLLGAVGFVLLIVCANVANLLFARGEARRREIALRAALGASRRRLVAQLLSESVLLAALGGGLGLLAAVWGLDALLGLYPGNLPRAEEVAIDRSVLLFSAALTTASGVLFGIVPALRGTSFSMHDALKADGRSTRGSASSARLRRVLVVCELAASLALLIGAGLLMRSFGRLRQTEPGFDPDDVMTVSLSVPEGTYPQPAQVRQFYTELMERISSLPSVASAGAISSLPLLTGAPPDDFRIEGRPDPAPGETQVNADFVMVTPGLFDTLRIPLRRGRPFTGSDARGTPPVAIINEGAARKYWPGEDPLGKRIRTFFPRTSSVPGSPSLPWSAT